MPEKKWYEYFVSVEGDNQPEQAPPPSGNAADAIAQIAGARPAHPPRVLLTTLPGEVHGLGLLMAECFMVMEGCHTIPLGVQTPLIDIARAVEASDENAKAPPLSPNACM